MKSPRTSAFSDEDKVRIAEALCRVGIRRMEVFLTVPGWPETVRALMRRRLDMAVYVTWHPGRVERALELGVKHIMVWYRIGEVFQQHVLKRSRKELLDEMLGAVRTAREIGAHVNVFMPESTRASLEHLRMAVGGGQEAGGQRDHSR